VSWQDRRPRARPARDDYAPDPWSAELDPGPPRRRPRRILTPTRVTLVVAVLGSVAYLAYAVTVRDTRQIPLLASGAAVLALVFGALSIAGGVATYQAGSDGRMARALVLAIAGGLAAIVAAGAVAFAVVLVLAYRP
jgi:hypothetical protein